MFRRTNTMWKVLALALCLCMLPTVAMATSNTVDIAYNGEVQDRVQLTVTYGSGEANKEVTILAIRKADDVVYEGNDGDAYAYDADDLAEDLTGRIAYIDQETTNAEGKVTFDFIPAATAASTNGAIDIYVGGEGVLAAEVEMITVIRLLPSPEAEIAEGTWYAGDNLAIELSGAVADDEAALQAWKDGITGITVTTTGGEIELTAENVFDGDTVAIPWDLVEYATITGIEFKSNSHNLVKVGGLGEGLAAQLKATGELEVGEITYTSATETTVKVTLKDAGYAEAMAAAMDAETITITIGETAVEYALDGNELTLTMPEFTEAEAKHVVSINVDCYELAEVEVALVTPTKEIADALGQYVVAEYIPDSFYEDAPDFDAEDPEKEIKWGKQVAELPTNDEGATITWTVKNGETPVEGTDGEGIKVFELARSTEGAITYTVTAVVENGDFYASEYAGTITVNKLGVAGVNFVVDPTAKFSAADAAALATVTLKKGDNEIATANKENGFAFEAIPEDTYTAVIARPGYVTLTAEVVVTADGAAFELPAMIAGDIEPDGKVDSTDFTKLNGVFWAIKGDGKYIVDADLNGDNKIDSEDFVALNGNFWYGTN